MLGDASLPWLKPLFKGDDIGKGPRFILDAGVRVYRLKITRHRIDPWRGFHHFNLAGDTEVTLVPRDNSGHNANAGGLERPQ
jgi:hypothetical protein